LLYRFKDSEDLERQMLRVLDEPELVKQLIENLPEVPEVRDGIADIESFYLSVLGVSSAPATDELAALV